MSHRSLQPLCWWILVVGVCCQASYVPAFVPVADIKYTLISTLHEAKAASVLVHGCDNVPAGMPELHKEGFKVTVICRECDTTTRVETHLKLTSSTTALPGGGSISVVACNDSTPPAPHDALVLDVRSCKEHQYCVAADVLHFLHLATAANIMARLFVVIDFRLGRLSVVNVASGEVLSYAESGGGARKGTHEARSVFSDVYTRQAWGPDGGGSGEGSSLEYTANLRAALVPLLAKYRIGSMMDAACGSFLWMQHVLPQLPAEFKYTGIDVACPVLQDHVQRFRDKPNWRFYCADICHQPLPKGFDLVFSRDTLQHVPLEYVFSFLQRVKESGAKYLLVGSYMNRTGIDAGNKDIQISDYYSIDLTLAPFNVRPAPLEVVHEQTADGKHMLLYDVATMTWNNWLPDPADSIMAQRSFDTANSPTVMDSRVAYIEAEQSRFSKQLEGLAAENAKLRSQLEGLAVTIAKQQAQHEGFIAKAKAKAERVNFNSNSFNSEVQFIKTDLKHHIMQTEATAASDKAALTQGSNQVMSRLVQDVTSRTVRASGIAEGSSKESASQLVDKVMKAVSDIKLKVGFLSSSIVSVQRVGRFVAQAAGGLQRPRSIRFTVASAQEAEAVVRERRKLKGTSFVIMDELTPQELAEQEPS